MRNNSRMSQEISCVELKAAEWERLREIRLAALRESPQAFGGKYEDEKLFDEARWFIEFNKQSFLVSSINGSDAAMLFVENLAGDFGATCWIGGCWSDPKYRGSGLMRAMFAYIDNNATERDWQVQGLGVWQDNYSAIAAYEKLGFVPMGEPQPSSRQPGKFYQRMIRKTLEN